jgi:hypothetical protein
LFNVESSDSVRSLKIDNVVLWIFEHQKSTILWKEEKTLLFAKWGSLCYFSKNSNFLPSLKFIRSRASFQ